MYSIKAITSLTGLTAETLRAWERRYQGILPARSENGRRLYSPQDLEKLTLLAELTRNGHAISKIVSMDSEALQAMKSQATQHSGSDLLQLQIIEALMDYRIERCEQLLKRALLACEPIDYVKEILLPALRKIGDLWHQQRISIAQEHMFSCCVKRIVLSMVNNLQNQSSQALAMLFATPSDEPHEFGILLSCLLASALQYRCYYLGANLPGKDIVEAVEHLRPAITVIGLMKNPPESTTIEDLQLIGETEFMTTTSFWLGGSGARQLKQLPANAELLMDIDEFYRKAQQWQLLNGL